MASTAKERIMKVDRLDSTLLNRKIKFSNGLYMTVRDYLIDVYPDSIEFDESILTSRLQSRVVEAEKTYNEFIEEIVNNKLADAKYNEQLKKDKDSYMTFVDYIKSLPIGSVNSYGIKLEGNIISFEDLYNKFAKDVYVDMEEELKDVPEVSNEEYELAIKQHSVGEILYDLVVEKNLDREAIFNNIQFINSIMVDYVNSITDLEKGLQDGSIKAYLNNKLDETLTAVDDYSEIEKMNQSIANPVDSVEEIKIDGFGPSIESNQSLTGSEVNALYTGLSYTEQKKADEIRMSGPEDPEDVDLDGTTETEVELNENKPKIRM